MRLIVASLAALVVALGVGGVAQASSWIPGTSYFVEESDASDLLEQTYDSAYCDGVARFGHRGEFPYEEFKVFDCSVHMRSYDCYDNRYKAVKSSRRGWFRLKLIAKGDCY
jgi:hypothetical protein